MKQLKYIFFVCLLYCLPMVLFAQRNFRFDDYGEPAFKPEYFAMGFRIGGGVASLQGLDGVALPGLYSDVLPYKTRLLGTMSMTLYGQMMFYNQLMLQADFSFVHFGATLKNKESSRELRGAAFHSRFLFGSKLGIERQEGLNFVFGVGPFVSLGSGGGEGEITSPYSSSGEIRLEKLDIKTVNAGVSAMLGFEYEWYSLTLSYDHGLTNLAKHGTMRTRGLRLELGFMGVF